MVQIATSNQTAIHYIPEVTYNVTPATPTFVRTKVTSEGLNPNYTFVQSETISPDRGVPDIILSDLDATGDIAFELQFDIFEWLMEMALCSTFTGRAQGVTPGVIKNGVLSKSVSVQKIYQDIAVPVYQTFSGIMCDTLSLSLQSGSIVTATAGLIGAAVTVGTSQIAGGSVSDPTLDGEVLSSATSVTSIREDSVTSTMNINSMSIDIANNLRAQKAIGTLGNIGVGLGQFNVSGNLSVYFVDLVQYNKFLAQTSFAFDITLTDSLGNYYTITLPKVKIDSAKIVAGGSNQDIMVEATYKALQDTVSSATIQIDSWDAA